MSLARGMVVRGPAGRPELYCVRRVVGRHLLLESLRTAEPEERLGENDVVALSDEEIIDAIHQREREIRDLRRAFIASCRARQEDGSLIHCTASR